MTRKDIIRMAREAGCEETWGMDAFRFTVEELEKFFALAAAHERQWVGLKDEEIDDAQDAAATAFKKSRGRIRGQQITPADNPDWWFAHAIEAKLKEKNHG